MGEVEVRSGSGVLCVSPKLTGLILSPLYFTHYKNHFLVGLIIMPDFLKCPEQGGKLPGGTVSS